MLRHSQNGKKKPKIIKFVFDLKNPRHPIFYQVCGKNFLQYLVKQKIENKFKI